MAKRNIAFFYVDYDSRPITVPSENTKICEYFQYLCVKREYLVRKSYLAMRENYPKPNELGKMLPIFSLIFIAAKICEICEIHHSLYLATHIL